MGLTWKIGFQVDDKEIANSLSGIKKDIQNAFNTNIRMSDQISQAVVEAKALEKAMKRATTDKGISYYSLQAELRKCGTSAAQLTTNLAMGGEQFRASLNAANVALATSNRTVISLNSQIKEMARVMLQSFKFTAAQTVIRNITKMCQQAVGWVKELNSAVNAIGVVTGKSEAQLAKVTEASIQGAKNLRIAADEYAKAALIFYQQGLGDDEVKTRTEVTIKAAKAAGVAVDEMSQQLTAIWNTYGMIGDEQARAASVGAKLAASTAADFADIAEAMQTSASAASQMGVSYDSLASIIATVKDTTQQSASTIGNAYKTIFSRFEQLKSAGTDGEVTLNRVSQQLDELGVHVLDSSGELRKLDDVIMELGTGWDNYTQKQKLAIAETVGGTRQYGQFLALMQNFDKYQANLNLANAETGADTLEQQYSQAMESVTEKANRASESWKRAFGEIITEDQLKGVYDISNDIAGVVETIFKGMGGLPGILATVAAFLSSKIGPAVSNIVSNIGVGAASFFGGQKGRDKMIDKDYDQQAVANESMRQGASASEIESLNIQKQKLEVSRETAHVINQIDTLEKSASGAYKIKLNSLREQAEKKLEIYQTTLDELDAMKQQTAENEKQLAQEARKAEATKLDNRTPYQAQVNEAYADLEQAQANQRTIGKEAHAARLELSSMQKNGASQADIDAQIKKVNDLQAAWDKAQVSVSNASAAYQAANKALKAFDATPTVEKTSLEFTKLTEQVRDFSATGQGDVSKITGGLTALAQSFGFTEQDIKNANTALTDLGDNASLQDQQEYCQNFLQAVKNLLTEEDHLDEKTQKLADTVIDKTQKMGEARNGIRSSGERAQQPPESNGPKQKEKIDVSGAIGGMAQVATAAVTATMAVKNLWTTMSNPDASIGEKLTSLGQSVIMLVPAFKSASAGVKALSAAIHASVPVVLAVIAAIAALIAIVSFLYSEWKNKQPEARLKAMQAAAEGLKEAEEEAKKAADNLRASFDKYESAKKKLDDCKRGTDEWTAALKEANDAALEVIDNLPSNMSAEEIKGLYKQENGILTLDEEGIKKAQKALDTEAAKASYAASMGSINVARASNDLQQADLIKAFGDATGHIENYGGSSVYLEQSSKEITDIIKGHLEELNSAVTDSEFKEKLGEFGAQIEYLDDTEISALRSSLNSLAKNSDAVNAKFDILSRLKADEILGDDYSDAEKNYASEQLQAETDAIYDKVLGSLTNGQFGSSEEAWKYGDISKGQTEINAELLARFNKATGNNWTSSQNGIQGTDTSRFFEFLDDQGELHKLSAEQVAQQIAASEALAKLGESADTAREALAKLKDNEVLQNATTAFLANGNMNSIKKSDLESINNEESWNQLSPELQSAYGTFEDYQKAITSSMTAISEAAKNSTGSVKAAYAMMDLGDISADTADIVVDALDEGFRNAGKEGMSAVSDLITSLGEDGAEEFQEIYEAIDWTNPDMDELNRLLMEQDMNTQEAAEAAEKLVKALKKQTEQTIESAQASYAAGKKIAQKLEQYDTVDPEDIAQLQEMGVATDMYFQQLADGTYMLTEDASTFRNIVDQINIGKMKEATEALQANYDNLSNYSGKDLTSLTTEDRINLLQGIKGNDEAVQTAIQEYRAAQDYANTNSEGDAQDGLTNAANKLKEIYDEANITSELVANTIKETATEIAEAQKAIEEANFQNAVQEYGLDLEETANYADVLAEELEITESQAKKLAIANQRLDRGCTDLNKNFSDYKKVLKDENKATAEYAKTLKTFKSSLADILNVSEDVLSNKFAKKQVENSELLEKAISGDAEALAELKKQASVDIGTTIIENLQSKVDALNKSLSEADPDSDAFAGLKNAADEATAKLGLAQTAWDTLKGRINSGIGDMPVGEFETAMNTLITEAGMTYEQVTSLLGSMGVDAEVETTNVSEEREVPTTIEHREQYDTTSYRYPFGVDEAGNVQYATAEFPIFKTYTTPGEPTIAEGFFPTYSVKVKSGNKESGGSIDVKSSLKDAGAMLPAPTASPSATSPTTTGGGSKSAPKKFEKGEYHQRYTDTKQKLDSVSKSIEKYNSAADDSVGARKLSNMKKANALLAKQGQLYGKLYQEALAYAKADKVEMQKSLSSLGITLKFNEDDTIANMEEIQKKWDEMLNATDLNGNGLLDESEEELYEKTKENIEEQQKQIDKYIESVDEMNQALQDAVNNVREYMNAKIEEINVRVEMNLKPLERDIDSLSRSIEFLGQVGLRTGKTFDLIGKKVDDIQKKFKEYQSGANDASSQIADIQSSLKNPAKMKEYIDTHGAAAWQEYLRENGGVPAEALQAMEDNVDNIASTMDEAYDALDELYSAYAELFESFIDQFDLINGRLENNYQKLELYEKIYEASGDKSTARKESEVATASAKRNNKEQAYKVAQNTRDTYKDELARRQKAYDDFMKENGLNTKDFNEKNLTEAQAIIYNRLKESVTEAQQGLQDAESQVMSTFEEVLDAAVEEAEKKTELARAQFVESITNGMFNDIEMMSTYYDDLEEKRKFYVDDYDKDYYLDKFDYQIDDYLKDANIVDPSRMAEWEKFQQRINDLRAEGVQLTQSQIDKLQAEFELQKLYDQYEEAQNAKTTMRLTRDASGNYNYVYSSDADSEDAADIAQKIRDKEKEIRDMGKSIIEEMSNTYLATSKELEEYLAENGGIADEHAMMLKERLNRIAGQISQQCKETGIDFKTTSLGIISDTEDMAACHEKFTANFLELEKKEQEANNEKAKTIKDNCTDIGIDYDNLAEDVGEATDDIIADDKAAAAAAKQLYTDTNTAMANAAKSVESNSKKICANIQTMITAYENLIKEIEKYKKLSEQDISLYDEDTDYSAKLYNEWLKSGKTAEEFLKSHQGEVEERMFAAADRGVKLKDYDNNGTVTVEEATKELVELFNQWKSEGKGAFASTTVNKTTTSDGGSGKLNTGTTTTTTTTTTPQAETKTVSKGDSVTVKTSATNFSAKSSGAKMASFVPGGTYTVMQVSGDEVLIGKNGSATGWVNKSDLVGFRSGGYVGEWGSEGRLAMVHEKELVLNEDDTKNILEAVKEVRSAVVARTTALNKAPVPGTPKTEINESTPVLQDVKIDATFPNVSVASEVEEAFEDLINKTVQYAGKK